MADVLDREHMKLTLPFHAADAEDPDTELERIVRSKLGLLCAHEGIGPRIEP